MPPAQAVAMLLAVCLLKLRLAAQRQQIIAVLAAPVVWLLLVRLDRGNTAAALAAGAAMSLSRQLVGHPFMADLAAVAAVASQPLMRSRLAKRLAQQMPLLSAAALPVVQHARLARLARLAQMVDAEVLAAVAAHHLRRL